MPYFKLRTNTTIEAGQRPPLLRKLSHGIAAALGKPERYIMVTLEDRAPMLFAGSDAPTAFLELKSIGLEESATAGLSQDICGLINAELDIDPERIYIEFANAPRKMWGWNNGTF